MRYLYIFEDGTVRNSSTEPTQLDWFRIDNDELKVIDMVNDLVSYHSSDKWIPLEAASEQHGYHIP
jgi:hypothetical protein